MKVNLTFRRDIEIIAKHFLYAVKMKDAAACASLYSETASKIFSSDHILKGRNSVKTDFEQSLNSGDLNISSVSVEDCRAECSIGFAVLRIATIRDQFIVMLGLQESGPGEWLITHELVSN